MTVKEFLEQPPIVMTFHEHEVRLTPAVDHVGCKYQSPPLDFLFDGPDGKYRVTGRFTLRCPYSRHWPEKS